MASALHLVVRLAHVVGMAVLLGGAVVTWQTLRVEDRDPRPMLRRYEWLFWGSIGVLIATGVGNLGALGPPDPATRWGSILTIKLLVVSGFVVLSAVRALAVCRVDDGSGSIPAPDRDRLRLLYGATGWALGATVALAEVLAHG
jgi:hypothetical protein